MRMSDGSSDVCSSDLSALPRPAEQPVTGLSDGRRKMGWAARKRDDWPMRRSHLTARPGRARFCAGALGLLLVSAATALPAAAQSVPPDPATKAAMDKRTAARTLMRSEERRVGKEWVRSCRSRWE